MKRASLCTFAHGRGRGGVQDEAGAPGLIFRVDSIQRTGPDAAVVEGGYRDEKHHRDRMFPVVRSKDIRTEL